MRVDRRVRARAVVWCSVLLSWSAVARAQTNGITVDEAVRQALDRNLTLLAERYSVNVAQARVLAAQLRPNPVFTYNLMLPDSSIFDNNINPRENVFRTDVILEGGGKRERRVAVAEQDRKSVV